MQQLAGIAHQHTHESWYENFSGGMLVRSLQCREWYGCGRKRGMNSAWKQLGWRLCMATNESGGQVRARGTQTKPLLGSKSLGSYGLLSQLELGEPGKPNSGRVVSTTPAARWITSWRFARGGRAASGVEGRGSGAPGTLRGPAPSSRAAVAWQEGQPRKGPPAEPSTPAASLQGTA